MANRKLKQEDVVERFKNVHGEKYDYSKFVYIDKKTKSIITCKVHGDFLQTPHHHLLGCGCPLCARISQRKKITTKHFGVGVYDIDNVHELTSIVEKARSCWRAMIQRCYDKKFQKKHPTYIGCYVCDSWLTFSVFLRWFKDNYVEGFELDKDLLVKGNKVYSPDTCCFVPHEINGFLCKCDKLRKKDLFIGVKKNSDNTFSAMVRKGMKNFVYGKYATELSAFDKYKQEKESYAKEIANKYSSVISEKAYKALVNYKVDLND